LMQPSRRWPAARATTRSSGAFALSIDSHLRGTQLKTRRSKQVRTLRRSVISLAALSEHATTERLKARERVPQSQVLAAIRTITSL
jgi:hypothetical protein